MGYWIREFLFVLAGYIFLLYLWPSVVFRKKLQGKSLTYRFAFCSTVMILLVNTLVLGLGLLHILKGGLVAGIVYGAFLWALLGRRQLWASFFWQVRTFFDRTQGWKTLVLRLCRIAGSYLEAFGKKCRERLKGHRLEYALLAMLMVFAVTYFSYGAFQNHSYGWGDMAVHHAWIYGLQEGRIFSDGVYPEAMHCFIYTMHAIFGIPVFSCLLFLGEIHVTALLASVYVLLREIMRSKYTVYFVLAAFLTVDVVCVDEIYGMSRLQYTIPQEFGLYTLFLCTLFLIRFLKNYPGEGKKRRMDGDLFLFTMAFAASIAIHFYVTIMAFFLCASFVLFGLHRVFVPGNLKALLAAVFIGLFISVMPMALAYASGIPLQGSLNWGMNIINGTDTKEGRTQAAQTVIPDNTEMQSETTKSSGTTDSTTSSYTQGTQAVPAQQVPHRSMVQRLLGSIVSRVSALKGVYPYGYIQLYGAKRAAWLLRFTGIAACLGLVQLLMGFVKTRKLPFVMYPGLTFASVCFMILYAAPYLGLPEIIAGARLCLPEQILLLSMMAIPVDALLALAERTRAGFLSPYVALLGVLAIYAGTQYAGVFHGYLYYELTRYNAVVDLTNSIIEDYPKYSYTIVSTTEELYQVIEDGRHEELLDFYNNKDLTEYYIPTEYLFFYVEKRPIRYAQYHFFSGPSWLAKEKYPQYYRYSDAVLSEGNAVKKTSISDQAVGEPLVFHRLVSDAYTDSANRRILESEMYAWCQNFAKAYPNEMKVYYEDDEFVCYAVKQNTEHLYNLAGY